MWGRIPNGYGAYKSVFICKLQKIKIKKKKTCWVSSWGVDGYSACAGGAPHAEGWTDQSHHQFFKSKGEKKTDTIHTDSAPWLRSPLCILLRYATESCCFAAFAWEGNPWNMGGETQRATTCCLWRDARIRWLADTLSWQQKLTHRLLLRTTRN